jgi:hypothetical protein
MGFLPFVIAIRGVDRQGMQSRTDKARPIAIASRCAPRHVAASLAAQSAAISPQIVDAPYPAIMIAAALVLVKIAAGAVAPR